MGKILELNELNKNARGGTELMAEGLRKYVDNELLDQFQIIQSRVRELDPNKKKILWVHDLAQDPEVEHLKDGGWKKFDKIVFVSHWQQQMYNLFLGVPYSAGVVLKNAIEPIPFHEKPNDETIRLVYTSTPHRGLNILYSAFDVISQYYDNVELDVYSSFSLYGWPQRDEPYKDLFKALEDHPKINYHGAVSNEDLKKALMKADIFAYPSTWQETSCLALIEAMSAGCLCLHSSLAALPETSMSMTGMYQYTEDQSMHANEFALKLDNMLQLLSQEDYRNNIKNNLHLTKQVIDATYSWNTRKQEWENLLKNMLTS